MEETKNMKCYKRLIYKKFVQVSGLCGPWFLSIWRNVSRTFEDICMETPYWCTVNMAAGNQQKHLGRVVESRVMITQG